MFLLQRIEDYITGQSFEEMQPVLDVFAFWHIRPHQRGLLRACVAAWREGTLDDGILQAVQKLTNNSYELFCKNFI